MFLSFLEHSFYCCIIQYVDGDLDGICRDTPEKERVRWNQAIHRADLRNQGFCSLGIDQVDMLYHGGDAITRHGQALLSYIMCDLVWDEADLPRLGPRNSVDSR